MIKTIGAVIVVGLFILCSHRTASEASETAALSNDLEEALRWFPEDTETVIAARGPFNIPREVEESPQPQISDLMRLWSLAPLMTLQATRLSHKLTDQTVLLSIEGSRHFRAPKALGGMKYEGSHIVFFGSSFGALRESLLKSLASNAHETASESGRTVYVFEQKLEEDIWKFYVALVKENVLVCATSRSYLSETLARVDSVAKRSALPESLPEWQYIDMQSNAWAIRHYNRLSATSDPSSPLRKEDGAYSKADKEAIGIAISLNGKRLDITYLSSNPIADKIAGEFWGESCHVRFKAKNAVEIGCGDDPEGVWFLALLGALGHGVFV